MTFVEYWLTFSVSVKKLGKCLFNSLVLECKTLP